jgi:hypothetical protein
MDNYHSGIKRELKEKFMILEDSRAESLKNAFHRAEASLRLKNIDPFEAFESIDEAAEN